MKFLIGLIVGVVCTMAALFGYFFFGFAPVAASSAPMPMERYLAGAALRSARHKAAGVQPPFEATEAHLMAGARNYRSSCAVCHGLPGVGKTPIQAGMYPHPPALLTGEGVTDDPPGETHWVIQKGIRMTGMPSFEGAYSDEQLWEVALLLAHADKLPPAVQEFLRQPDRVPVESAGQR